MHTAWKPSCFFPGMPSQRCFPGEIWNMASTTGNWPCACSSPLLWRARASKTISIAPSLRGRSHARRMANGLRAASFGFGNGSCAPALHGRPCMRLLQRTDYLRRSSRMRATSPCAQGHGPGETGARQKNSRGSRAITSRGSFAARRRRGVARGGGRSATPASRSPNGGRGACPGAADAASLRPQAWSPLCARFSGAQGLSRRHRRRRAPYAGKPIPGRVACALQWRWRGCPRRVSLYFVIRTSRT